MIERGGLYASNNEDIRTYHHSYLSTHHQQQRKKAYSYQAHFTCPFILIIFSQIHKILVSHSQLFKMRQSIIVSILSMAMAVSAVPTSIAPTNNVNVNQCSGGNNKQVCCNNGLLGLLTCSVQVLGGACDGSVTCCNTQAAEVSCFFPTLDPTLLIPLPLPIMRAGSVLGSLCPTNTNMHL